MAQTLTRLLVHVVYSTKRRVDSIPADLEPELYAYIGGICRGHECSLMAAGGTRNHSHLLISLSKNLGLSEVVMDVKKDSSKFLKRKGVDGFGWQDGYGGFTIGESQVAPLRGYIARQKERHRTMTFEEEFLSLLKKYRVDYDPRYVWD